MRVLGIGAHPDDLELQCGGTLVRYAQAGHRVWMCTVTDGSKGSFVHGAAELAAIRAEEALQAASIAGAEWIGLGVPDGEVFASDPAQRRAVVDVIRVTKPDVVITHFPDDYQADHNEVSRLVFDAAHMASLPGWESEHPHHDVAFSIFFMDTLAGLGFQPTEYVDVSDVFDRKIAMLRAHQSQLQWLSEHDAIDPVEAMRTAAAYRGGQCGVRFAEGFRQLLVWPRVVPQRLLP
jgi:LmbE family N-acetylglucosaminyl deacetylase